MNTIKDIISDNPIKETWKYLRFFLDVQATSEQICRMHNISRDNNVKKQAIQLGYCIRQAEEYFQASAQVGLPTRPTLLYYGAVSLSQALILLKKDGTHSFDALRKERRHRHHGLELVGEPNIKNPETFFSSLQCDIHTAKDGSPWGNFSLFYKSLTPGATSIERYIYRKKKQKILNESSFLQGKSLIYYPDLPGIETLASVRLNSLELLKTLPDMFHRLKDLGIEPNLCEGNVRLEATFHYEDEEAERDQRWEKIQETFHFFLNRISPDQKNNLLNWYKQNNSLIEINADYPTNLNLRLTIEYVDRNDTRYFLPDVVEDIYGQIYFILGPGNYAGELTGYLAILFCIGMLSRYYPDIWMKAIDTNVQIAELTDSFLNVAYRKFPNLILDQMTAIKHHIHL